MLLVGADRLSPAPFQCQGLSLSADLPQPCGPGCDRVPPKVVWGTPKHQLLIPVRTVAAFRPLPHPINLLSQPCSAPVCQGLLSPEHLQLLGTGLQTLYMSQTPHPWVIFTPRPQLCQRPCAWGVASTEMGSQSSCTSLPMAGLAPSQHSPASVKRSLFIQENWRCT